MLPASPTAVPSQAPIVTDDLVYARRICLLAAVLYPAWGWLCLVLIPDSHENVWERMAVGAFALGLWLASHLSLSVAARLPYLLNFVYVAITFHYLRILADHPDNVRYAMGTFITVASIDACIQRMPQQLAYTAAALTGASVVALNAPFSATGAFLVFGLATIQLLSLVSLHARLATLQRLEAARQALAEANEALRRADRYKDDFLAIISHELRTPLNAVYGFGSVLEEISEPPLTPVQASYVAKMMNAAGALLALVDDLLDMSRIQAGRLAIEQRPMAFGELAEGVVERLGSLAHRSQQAVVVELPPDLPLISADARRVEQVLTNLLGNALKFGEPGATVVVRARVADQHLRCEVADGGPGIAEAAIPRLFKPFSQLDSSATRRAGGTGLGLSISKALVEAHGGRIGVKSRPEDGSTFWFELPIAPAEAPLSADPR